MEFSTEYLSLFDSGKLVELLKYSKSNNGIEAKYWELYSLLHLGKTIEARQKLDEYKEDFIEDIWKSRFYFLYGFDQWGQNSDLALEYFKKSFEIALKLDDKKGIANYYVFNGMVLHLRSPEAGIEFLNKGFSFSQKINYKYPMYWYYQTIASIMINRGKFDEAIKNIQLLEDLCTKMNNKFFLAFVFELYGFYYVELRQYDKALEYYEKELDLTRSIEHGWSEANCLISIADIYKIKGLLDEELNYLYLLYDLELKLGRRSRIANVNVDIADVFMEKGKIDEALEKYLVASSVHQDEKFWNMYSYSLIQIGAIHKLKGDYIKALNYFEQAYQIRLDLNESRFIAFPLMHIIQLLSVTNREDAKSYLDTFAKLENSEYNEFITPKYNFTKAIYLKNSNRLKDKIQAQLILEELVLDAKKKNESRMEYIPHLLELLIIEYTSSKESEVLDEIHNYLTEYISLAENENRFPALVKGLLIQAQLAQSEGNYSESQKLLEKGLEIAIKINIPSLIMQVENSKRDLEAELTRMEELVTKNVDIASKIKESNLLSYVTEAQQFIQKTK